MAEVKLYQKETTYKDKNRRRKNGHTFLLGVGKC